MKTTTEPKCRSRNDIITDWYEKAFPSVASYIQKRGGDLEEAKEVFQQAVIIYYEKLRFNAFAPEKTDKAYLVGIAKNRWLKYSTERKHYHDLGDLELLETKEQQWLTSKLLMQLKQAGERCLDVLQAFYFEKLTMPELANRFGYSSVRSATVQKFKCLEKVRNQVKRKAMSYEDFLK